MAGMSSPLSRRALLGGALAGGLGLAGLGTARAQSAQAATLATTDWYSRDGRTISAQVRSPSLSHPASVRILLPASYDDGRRYPVVYLLHGSWGDANSWCDQAGAADITAGSEAIFVMPDGGKGGWYTDHDFVSSGVANWETFHTRDVVSLVDDRLRTIPQASARGIAGFSMGGYGAAIYASHRPDIFGALGVYSGATDAYDMRWREAMYSGPANDGENAGAIFGAQPGQEDSGDLWRRQPGNYASSLVGRRVRLYTGRESGYEDALRNSTGVFRDALTSAGVRDLAWIGVDGGHDWGTAGRALAQDVDGLVGALDRPRW